MKTGTVAFDYERQVWVHGTEALNLLRGQAEDRLTVLRSADGEEYARFIGMPHADAVRAAEADLADANTRLANTLEGPPRGWESV